MNFIENLGSKIACLYRKRASIINSKLKHLDINFNQSILLVNIGRNPGLNQNQLKELLNLDKTSISKILRILEERGLLNKQLNINDKRYYQIYLSQKGEVLLLEIRAVLSKIWDEHLQGVSPKEKDLFLIVLDRILENIDKCDD